MIPHERYDYDRFTLDEADLRDDPIEQLSQWLKDARAEKVIEPTAMTLATVDSRGRPHARVVLLRQLDSDGLVFYTSYDSPKAWEIDATSSVALTFWWAALERQVRVEGLASRITEEESDAYFSGRPLLSQWAAVASPQSQPITSRDWLEQELERVKAQYPDGPPRPLHWGGFRVAPERIEFWQGRRGRLHDRLVYQRDGDNWTITRLAP